MQKDVDAQVAITQKFSTIAPKEIADFAEKKVKELKDQKASPDEIAKWEEGGSYRVALHTLSGGLSGGLSGALGAGAVAESAKLLDTMQTNAELALVQQGVSPKAAKAMAQSLAQATALGLGVVVGGEVGAATSLAVDTNNRQLHFKERDLIESLAKAKAEEACKGRGKGCSEAFNKAWGDALQKVASGLVDDKVNAANVAYLNELIIASENPNSEGARGALQQYLDIFGEAERMLSPYAGQQIQIKGINVAANGASQNYFQATASQKADSSINTFLGGKPTSIVPGMPLRDGERVDYFSALNGSALKGCTAEELLLGEKSSAQLLGSQVKDSTYLMKHIMQLVLPNM